MGTASGIIKALNSGIKHLAIKRFTLRYPEQKLKFVGDGYYSMINVQVVSFVLLHVKILLKQFQW